MLGMSALCLIVTACSDGPSDGIDSGGLEPPPGFLMRTDANCRAAAIEDEAVGTLNDAAPKIRQLNGQSLFGYTRPDGARVQCVVRHADESVVDIQVIGAE
jgi:hypothetical protein